MTLLSPRTPMKLALSSLAFSAPPVSPGWSTIGPKKWLSSGLPSYSAFTSAHSSSHWVSSQA